MDKYKIDSPDLEQPAYDGSSPQNKLVAKPSGQRPKKCFGERHLFVLMSFLAIAVNYAMRFTVPIGIVAMVKKDSPSNETATENIQEGQCSRQGWGRSNATAKEIPHRGELDWSAERQGVILGSFYYGYAISHVPGGILAERYGGKWIFGLCTGAAALVTLAVPLIAPASSGMVIGARFLHGLMEGAVHPTFYAMAGKWLPAQEKASLVSLAMFGMPTGCTLSLMLGGIIAEDLGWEYIFYVFGGCGLVWSVLWGLFMHESPRTNPRMSEEERAYILGRDNEEKLRPRPPLPPLKSIFTSVPALALCMALACNNWSYSVFLNNIPTYLHDVQGLPLDEDGILASLPYISMAVFLLPTGYLSDRLTGAGIVSTGAARKMFNTLGVGIPALSLVWLAYVGCNIVHAAIAMCLCLGSNGLIYGGLFLSFIDLSPNYAGTLYSICNCFSCIFLIASPYFTGMMIEEESSFDTWRVVFLTSAGLYTASGLIYVLFVPAQVQEWNTIREENTFVDEVKLPLKR